MSDIGKHVKRSGSKKSKKGWRKRTDIQDVEDYLVEKRTEERHGGIVSDKTDNNLFFVDGKFNKNVHSEKKKSIVIMSDDDDDEVYLSRKEKQMIKLQQDHIVEIKKSAHKPDVLNIWGQEAITITDGYLDSTMKPVKKMPSTMKKNFAVSAAVELDPSGASYNPDYENHQSLLKIAHERELRKIKNTKKLNEKVKMVSVRELKKLSKVWLHEMSQGLRKDELDGNLEDIEITNSTLQRSCPVSADDRKTLKERKRVLKSKEVSRQIAMEKRARKKMQDVFRLKSLKREIKMDETARLDRKNKRALVLQAKQRRTKRLSRHKFGEVDTVVQLSEDLSGSLRGLKVEGNLLSDRFRSLQKRNIIETRVPVVRRRKYKLKQFEKKSYKTKTIKELTHTSH